MFTDWLLRSEKGFSHGYVYKDFSFRFEIKNHSVEIISMDQANWVNTDNIEQIKKDMKNAYKKPLQLS